MKINRNLIWVIFSVPSFLIGSFLVTAAGYGDDQFEYYEYIKNLAIWNYSLTETIIGIKYRIMYILSPSVTIFNVSIQTASFINYMVLTYVLSRITSGKCLISLYFSVIILIPSVFIHSVTFLREIYVYISVGIFFFYCTKKKCQISVFVSLLTFVFIGLIRVDSALLISPFLIYFSRLSDKTKNAAYLLSFLFIYFLLRYNANVGDMLSAYRALFNMADYSSIYAQVFNFYLPSKGTITAQMISMWEFTVMQLIWILVVYYQRFHPLIFPYFMTQLIGIVLLGDISDNVGFSTRIRSIILFSILISMFVCALYKEDINGSSKK